MPKQRDEDIDQPEGPTNQTQFFDDELLFTQPATLPLAEPAEPKKPIPLFVKIIGGVGALIMAGLVALFLLVNGGDKTGTIPSPPPTRSESINRTELQQRIVDLQAELKKVDPVALDLTFPPVSDSIYLDTPKKN